MLSNGYLSLAVGDTCIGLRCSDDIVTRRMRRAYQPFTSDGAPEYAIDLNLHDYLTESEIGDVLSRLEAHCDGTRFFTNPWLIDCYLDRKARLVRVEAERGLFKPPASYRLMNHLLRGLYYSVYKWIRHEEPHAYLVHGCGVLSGGTGLLFTGPSGIGKTTVASLAGDRTVLNDETVLVGRNGSGFNITGTPFDGGVPSRAGVSERLSAVLMLRQADKVELKRLRNGDAYKQILAQVLDSSPLFDVSRLEYLPERADLSAELAASVPVYELGFRPDDSFWEVVESIGKESNQ